MLVVPIFVLQISMARTISTTPINADTAVTLMVHRASASGT